MIPDRFDMASPGDVGSISWAGDGRGAMGLFLTRGVGMKLENIKKTAMIGAGTMGAGFGVTFSLAGYGSWLYDISQKQLDLGRDRIAKALDLFIEEDLITPDRAEAAQKLIHYTTDLKEAVSGAQFLLEAVPEIMDLKKELYPQLEALLDDDAIMATNTSGLSVTEIASVCRKPDRVVGMHWFNPPEMVPLVEVTKGQQTDPAAAKLVYDLVEKVGHVPIMLKKEAPGFVANRMQMALFREALNIMAEGIADPEDIDRAVSAGVGVRWSWAGPMELADLGGLDTWGYVSGYMWKMISNASELPDFYKKMIDQGNLGLKTGQGFFEYDAAKAAEAVRQRDQYMIRQWKLRNQIKPI